MPLQPLDKSAKKDGGFPCGLVSNTIETKTVTLPAGYKCDHCILQFSWHVLDNTFHVCSDVKLPNGAIYFDAAAYKEGTCLKVNY